MVTSRRLSAVHGGVYMLNKPVDKIEYDADGRVCGVTSEGETAKCKMVIGDPSYFVSDNKVKQEGRVIRLVCIMSHPIPDTNNSDSCQVIIPQSQVGRSNDIYITCLGRSNCVAPEGKYVVIISSTAETNDPVQELHPAIKLLGKVDKIFALLNNIYVPANDFRKDGCFISSSFDATSHFETSVNDVLKIYDNIMSTLPPAERKVTRAADAKLAGAESSRPGLSSARPPPACARPSTWTTCRPPRNERPGLARTEAWLGRRPRTVLAKPVGAERGARLPTKLALPRGCRYHPGPSGGAHGGGWVHAYRLLPPSPGVRCRRGTRMCSPDGSTGRALQSTARGTSSSSLGTAHG